MIGVTFCKSVLEHIESPIKAILEMKRITAYKIIIVVPNVINMKRIFRTLINPLFKINFATRHLQAWDSKTIRHLAFMAGLNVLSVKWISENLYRWGYVFMPLFASHMIAVLKDVGEICEKCGTPKKRFWCDPDFSYCPNCELDEVKCIARARK